LGQEFRKTIPHACSGCNKTGLDLTKTPPSNPNPLQSYYGIYDSAIKKKLEKMISPNVKIGG